MHLLLGFLNPSRKEYLGKGEKGIHVISVKGLFVLHIVGASDKIVNLNSKSNL